LPTLLGPALAAGGQDASSIRRQGTAAQRVASEIAALAARRPEGPRA
jgi:hypothetical protein